MVTVPRVALYCLPEWNEALSFSGFSPRMSVLHGNLIFFFSFSGFIAPFWSYKVAVLIMEEARLTTRSLWLCMSPRLNIKHYLKQFPPNEILIWLAISSKRPNSIPRFRRVKASKQWKKCTPAAIQYSIYVQRYRFHIQKQRAYFSLHPFSCVSCIMSSIHVINRKETRKTEANMPYKARQKKKKKNNRASWLTTSVKEKKQR